MVSKLKSEFRGHFDQMSVGHLAFPKCDTCGKWHWYPMPLCPHCQSDRISWQRVRGVGEIWSWTVVRHPFERSYRDRLPYVVALVCFVDAPGIRLVANIESVPLDQLKIGLPVEFVPPAAGTNMPKPVFGPLRTLGAVA